MKKLLITGGGWLAQKLVKYFYSQYDITVLLRDEEKKWKLEKNWEELSFIMHDLQFPLNIKNKYDIIIHTAAMKHITSELLNKENVFSCNVMGTKNIVDFAKKNKRTRFIYISTDKAIKYINYYGYTKWCGELITNKLDNYAIVRFGNLFGSSGSFVQVLLRKLIWGEKVIEISHKDSERYFLTWMDAAQLIEKAIDGANIYYIGKYKSIKIYDMVKLLIPDAEIKIVGLRPGEKLKEDIDFVGEIEYYTNQEIIDMWEQSKSEEIGDLLT